MNSDRKSSFFPLDFTYNLVKKKKSKFIEFFKKSNLMILDFKEKNKILK